MARTVVGLDIGTSGVRAAEYRLRRRRSPSLRKYAAVALPEGAVRGGVVVDEAAVSDAIGALWKEGKFSTRAVVIGIANDGVLVRQMDLDWMPPKDFRKALHYQVAEALPVPVEEANLDYHLLEEVEVDGEKPDETRRVNRILLVAAARDVVDGFVTAAQGAGLRVVRADLLPFALIRAAALDPAEGALPEAVVDIGADTISVVVHESGRPRFVRMIPGSGSNLITAALQERYGWSWDDAERTKVVLGMPAPADARAGSFEHPAQHPITEEAVKLVAEVRATLEFFLASDTDLQALSRVVLTGAGSALGGLPEVLADQLRVQVHTLTPLTGVRAPRRFKRADADLTHLPVATGLCLGVVS
jgi:type IV pilus assembly protein PilM